MFSSPDSFCGPQFFSSFHLWSLIMPAAVPSYSWGFGPLVIQIIILFAFISIEHHLSLLVAFDINSDIVPVSKNVFGKPKLDSYNELQNYSWLETPLAWRCRLIYKLTICKLLATFPLLPWPFMQWLDLSTIQGYYNSTLSLLSILHRDHELKNMTISF